MKGESLWMGLATACSRPTPGAGFLEHAGAEPSL